MVYVVSEAARLESGTVGVCPDFWGGASDGTILAIFIY